MTRRITLTKARELTAGIVARAVALERRRIRRAQAKALRYLLVTGNHAASLWLHDIDAATRAPRRGKR